ncbi:MAG TPA: FkbM family methyltransferase, partial [Halomonas sp.]
GLYNYVNTDPVRKYMRGRAGHNVPLINGVSYSKDFEHRLKNWKVTDFSDSNENPFVTLELQVLESVIQKRTFSFLGEIKRLCVADEFTFSDEGTHDITLQWHVPTDKKISIENDKVSIVSSAGAQCILTFEDEKPDQIVVLQGQKKDKVYSCISYKTNALESSQVIRVIFRSRPSLSVKSVFDFISEKTISSAVSNTTLHDVEVSSNAYKIDLPDYKTDYIQKFIAEHKAPYESEMLDAMAIGLKPMDLVLDVGANIGNHTLYWACVLGCQVRAFEPNERLYKPLMNSVELNGITHLVNVLPYGVGKVPSKARFTSFDETNLGSQSLQVVSDEEDASIEVVRLDDQVFESPVVAIKIDVEGMELAVLEGAEVLIQKDRPLLVIESVDTTHYESLRDFIKRNDYIYCSSFNGTPTHFFIHQDKVSGSPWINLFFEKGHEFYQMRHFHKKLKKTLQQLSKTKK